MKEKLETVSNVLSYIKERTMCDDNTTFGDICIRFGTDPTFIVNGRLCRPSELLDLTNNK